MKQKQIVNNIKDRWIDKTLAIQETFEFIVL